MASQIRYYRSRYHQQRVFIERLRREVAELKKYRFITSLSFCVSEAKHGYVSEKMESSLMGMASFNNILDMADLTKSMTKSRQAIQTPMASAR